ncbi:MAG: glycosyltransferase, partial [Devosia sp.]|nr:glycosyltransferase [Devosia sp.]
LVRSLVQSGLQTIRARHTCRHRVDELLFILSQVGSARVTDQIDALEAAQ